jgi:hypothetical protein
MALKRVLDTNAILYVLGGKLAQPPFWDNMPLPGRKP